MPERKHSEDPTAQPSLSDLVVALNGLPSNVNLQLSAIKELMQSTVQLDTSATEPAHSPGLIWWDASAGCMTYDTPIGGVRNCVGQEIYIPVYNDTGGVIANGAPVSGSGLYVLGLPSVVESDADNILHVFGFLGVATSSIADGEIGFATSIGAVNDVDTSLLQVAPVYLASGGGLSNDIPTYPANRFLIGGVTVSDPLSGVIGVSPKLIPRRSESRSYSFTSQGVGAGDFWEAGFYDWSQTSASLSRASLTVSHGESGRSYAAHVGIVPNGPGSVDSGQVGIRVTGTLDSEMGAQVAAQTAIITDDITTLTADEMIECSEKFSGDILIELYVVSGSPTAYSVSFNYGYSKYEDFGNSDVTITGFEAKWRGSGDDSSADIALMHHKKTGWTYAASGFSPGNGDILRKTVDQSIDGDIVAGEDGAYKRVNLNQLVEGSKSDGVLINIITTRPNTFQTLDLHVSGVSEEIT